MIVDGWAIPEDESITFANGKQNAVDILDRIEQGRRLVHPSRQPTADAVDANESADDGAIWLMRT